VVTRDTSRMLGMLGILSIISITMACARAIEPNFVLTLKNDLSTRVVLSPCEDAQCHELAGSVQNSVSPGDTLLVNVSTEGVPSYYRVVTEQSETAGCLMLVLNETSQERIVPLSMAVDCRSIRPSLPSQSLFNVIIGWLFFFLIAVIGISISAVITIRAYRNLRGRGFTPAFATLLAAIVAVVAFLGLWEVALVYWLLRIAVQLPRRMSRRVRRGGNEDAT
jgi:hypothetical protein